MAIGIGLLLYAYVKVYHDDMAPRNSPTDSGGNGHSLRDLPQLQHSGFCVRYSVGHGNRSGSIWTRG
jgi:hypothetical protein